MSIPEQIRALESLAAIDAALKILDEQLAGETSTLSGLTANLKKLEEKLTQDRAGLAASEKARGTAIGDVRSMTQQIEHSRDKLNRSRTERESQAATREVEEMRKLLRDREEEVGRLTTDSDGIKHQIEFTEVEAKRISDELGSQSGDINARLAAAQSARSEKLSEREAATKRLPPALYRKYEVIRAKKGSGVTSTTDGTCKACHMSLPPQLFHRLRREPLLEQCQSCNRIIYFQAPTPVEKSTTE